ncbi:MAG TPA: glycosyltransferase [Chryseolinea sp.]|nr:glycosyltransferase [Chryseolinea sp.]
MQEVKKRRIVLASLLKPVDDTRMYEKLGSTLASSYEVHVIGLPAKSTSSAGNIHFIPLAPYSRTSLKRLLASWRVFQTVLRLRPDLLIVCTPELLPIALCVRALCGSRIAYDIHENYTRNILQGDAWPRLLRPLLALAVRTVEYITSPAVSHFLLAEQAYADELTFIRRDYSIIENKLVRIGHLFDRSPRTTRSVSQQEKPLRLLFSGTLAETTGVFTAISLAKRLHLNDVNIHLSVVGYAAQNKVRTELKELARNCGFIDLVGVDSLVPHSKILAAIGQADFGIIAYPKNPSTWSSYPTKLYEYLGCGLPILLIDNPKWTAYCAPYRAAVVFPADNPLANPTTLLAEMREGPFYVKPPENVFWDSEAPKLLQAVSKIFS